MRVEDLLMKFGVPYSSASSALDRQIALDNYLTEQADETVRCKSNALEELTDEHASLQGAHDDLEIDLKATRKTLIEAEARGVVLEDRVAELETIIAGNPFHQAVLDQMTIARERDGLAAEFASLKAFVAKKARKTLEAWEKLQSDLADKVG